MQLIQALLDFILGLFSLLLAAVQALFSFILNLFSIATS